MKITIENWVESIFIITQNTNQDHSIKYEEIHINSLYDGLDNKSYRIKKKNDKFILYTYNDHIVLLYSNKPQKMLRLYKSIEPFSGIYVTLIKNYFYNNKRYENEKAYEKWTLLDISTYDCFYYYDYNGDYEESLNSINGNIQPLGTTLFEESRKQLQLYSRYEFLEFIYSFFKSKLNFNTINDSMLEDIKLEFLFNQTSIKFIY